MVSQMHIIEVNPPWSAKEILRDRLTPLNLTLVGNSSDVTIPMGFIPLSNIERAITLSIIAR